jgi:hypothetical protein
MTQTLFEHQTGFELQLDFVVVDSISCSAMAIVFDVVSFSVEIRTALSSMLPVASVNSRRICLSSSTSAMLFDRSQLKSNKTD